jgi:hypothetical protein
VTSIVTGAGNGIGYSITTPLLKASKVSHGRPQRGTSSSLSKKKTTRDDFMQLQEIFPTPLQASKLAIDDWKKTFDIDFFAPCVRCLWCSISVAYEAIIRSSMLSPRNIMMMSTRVRALDLLCMHQVGTELPVLVYSTGEIRDEEHCRRHRLAGKTCEMIETIAGRAC